MPNFFEHESERLSKEDACFARGAHYVLNGDYEAAVVEFTQLILMEPKGFRGYLGRADARAAQAAEIIEKYRATGGRQYELTAEELLALASQPLHPPEKDIWWKLTERIMKLQYEAKQDYQKVLEIDPSNADAREGLRDLGE